MVETSQSLTEPASYSHQPPPSSLLEPTNFYWDSLINYLSLAWHRQVSLSWIPIMRILFPHLPNTCRLGPRIRVTRVMNLQISKTRAFKATNGFNLQSRSRPAHLHYKYNWSQASVHSFLQSFTQIRSLRMMFVSQSWELYLSSTTSRKVHLNNLFKVCTWKV